jgi:hypothetical protein
LTGSEQVLAGKLAHSLTELSANDGSDRLIVQASSEAQDIAINLEIPDTGEVGRIWEINQLQDRIDKLTALLVAAAEAHPNEEHRGIIEKVGLVEVEFKDYESVQICQEIVTGQDLKNELTIIGKTLSLSALAYQRIAKAMPNMLALFLCCLFDHFKVLGGADAGVLFTFILLTLMGFKQSEER